MSFFDSLRRSAEELVKGLKPEEVVKLRSCKNCYFCKKFPICTQTSPPTRILSEYQAQGCSFYSVEQPVVTSKVADVSREAKYLEAINQLLGFDNTFVATSVTDWNLMKTIVMENFENKVMNKVTYNYHTVAGNMGYLKVTATIDEGEETTIEEATFTNTDWTERTASISPVLENSKVTIKVYLKSLTGGESVYNEKFGCYGEVMQRFIYEEL